MATITERKGRFLVPVRRDGFKAVAKTFGKKQDAAAWARRVEADMESGRWLAKVAATPTLAQAIEEYRQGAGNKLKGRETYAYWLDELKTNRIASKRVNDLTPWPCAFNQPCRPRRAIGPTLRQAQTVHWTVCVRAQRWTGPAATPGCVPCAVRRRETVPRTVSRPAHLLLLAPCWIAVFRLSLAGRGVAELRPLGPSKSAQADLEPRSSVQGQQVLDLRAHPAPLFPAATCGCAA